MGKPRKPDVEITEAMIAASDKFLADLEDARMVKHVNLMGGTQGRSSWTRKVKKGPNRDLVIAVTTFKMKQAIATFLAISRAQKSNSGAAKPNPRGDVEVTEAMRTVGVQLMTAAYIAMSRQRDAEKSNKPKKGG